MQNTTTSPLQCVCGQVRGHVLHGAELFRVVCHCRWCAAYARFTGHEDQLRDAYGGTHVYQLSPAQIRLETGADQVACVRLSPQGAMRWHTACCKTPLGNGFPSARLPWVGMPHLALDTAHRRPDEHEALAKVRYRVNAGDRAADIPGAHASGPVGLVATAMAMTLRKALRGMHKPSPFYDDAGQARCTITVLSDGERSRLGLNRSA